VQLAPFDWRAGDLLAEQIGNPMGPTEQQALWSSAARWTRPLVNTTAPCKTIRVISGYTSLSVACSNHVASGNRRKTSIIGRCKFNLTTQSWQIISPISSSNTAAT